MVYLHVAQVGKGHGFSPLDTLFGLREPEFKHGICPFFVKSVQNQGGIAKALDSVKTEMAEVVALPSAN